MSGELKVAGAPISWGVSELPEWGYRMPATATIAMSAWPRRTGSRLHPHAGTAVAQKEDIFTLLETITAVEGGLTK